MIIRNRNKARHSNYVVGNKVTSSNAEQDSYNAAPETPIDPNKPLTIWVYVMCFNEITLAPYMIEYWKTYANKVIVYDNGSNDGCLELFKKYDWIEVRHFDTNGLDDLMHVKIKNSCWKECRDKDVDFVQVSDFDELIYCENLKEELKKHRNRGDYIFTLPILNVISEKLPEYKENTLLHKSKGVRFNNVSVPSRHFEKAILFNPRKIKEINYSPGCHTARPVKMGGGTAVASKSKIKLLHFNNLGIDFLFDKYRQRVARNTENRKRGFGTHYSRTKEQIEEYYNKSVRESKGYNEIDW